MVRKTYDSPNKVISSLTVFDNGMPRTIHFTPTTIWVAGSTGRGSQFVTCEEALQKAIESSPSFGRSFILSKTEIIDETSIESKEEAEEATSANVIQVSSPAEARDYLTDNYGIPAGKICSVKSIIKKAKDLGIIFEGI